MISNGLRDHTRAMPRPIANIVRACVCVTLRTELAIFGRTAVRRPAATFRFPGTIPGRDLPFFASLRPSLAAGNVEDQAHQTCLRLLRQADGPLLVPSPVLSDQCA